MAQLTDLQRAFIRDNAFCGVVTTLREDGSPHSTVVWVDERDGMLLFNTAYPRAKPRELERDARASIAVVDPQDEYRWIAVSGTATLSTEGANEDIDRLSRKYTGNDYQWHQEGETRVSVLLAPEKIDSRGL